MHKTCRREIEGKEQQQGRSNSSSAVTQSGLSRSSSPANFVSQNTYSGKDDEGDG